MASSIIYDNGYVTIDKKDTNTYEFIFENGIEYEIQSRSYELEKYTKNVEEKDSAIHVTLHLESVQTLSQLLSHKKGVLGYDDCVEMVQSMGTQLQYLEEGSKDGSYVFASLFSDNIIVLNDTKYIYLSNKELFQVNRENEISINYPLQKNDFMSPELQNIKDIPTMIHKNSWMFSFASIISLCLTVNKESYLNKTYGNKEHVLQSIEQLPLYYMLLRCFNEIPKKRNLIYV